MGVLEEQGGLAVNGRRLSFDQLTEIGGEDRVVQLTLKHIGSWRAAGSNAHVVFPPD
jgi:hypothetical protein